MIIFNTHKKNGPCFFLQVKQKRGVQIGIKNNFMAKSQLKTIQVKNNQKKEYCWKYDYDKWLITNNSKEQKTIKQFLMISIDNEYYDKYLELSISKIKGIFSFYLNLLWRVNGVRHYPDNVKLQPKYDAKLNYTT